MQVTFALCWPDTTAMQVNAKGDTYYPRTILNFCYGIKMGLFVELGCDRERAKQFPTRATAKKYAASIGRADYRVMPIAVTTINEA